MIGSIDWFGTIFSGPPDGDVTYNTRIAKAMIQEGLAVVLIHPGEKTPACTLSAKDAKKATERAREAAREAGHPNWDKITHYNNGECGAGHALTEVRQLTHVVPKKLLAEGCNLAVSFKDSTKPVLVIDVDTDEERRAFLRDWSEAVGETVDAPMTVRSPGVFNTVDGMQEWVHKDGGHYWFTLPNGAELPEHRGKVKWCKCHGGRKPGDGSVCRNTWVAFYGSGYVLVPPSVRKEGPYRVTGSAPEAPAWLIERVRAAVEEKTTKPFEGPRFDDDPIDAWAADTPWSEILAEDGYARFGIDTCGCDTYTMPGSPANPKSVTAHEIGCTQYSGDRGHNPIHIWSDAISGPATQSKLTWVATQRFGGDMRTAMESLNLTRLGGVAVDQLESFGPADGRSATVHNITDARPRTDGSSALAPHQDAQGGEQEPPVTVFEMQVAVEVQKIKVREEAARRLRRERVDASPPTVSLLSDFLAIEDDPVAYRIHDLLPQGGRAVLAAQFKAGKTTIIGNLIRSLVDGDRFLGHFDVEPVTGRVVVLDDELDERMLRRWLRDQGIRNTDRVVVVPLRGKVSSFDILDPQGRAEWSALLAAAEAEIVILDCLAPALDALGLSEDKEAGRFLVAFDELLKTSGTSEAIVVHHMGHSGERSRGASRLRDWPDVEWRLVRDKSDGEDDPDARRYFSAYGRDVNVPEAGIEYDAITRHLSISDPFSGAADNRKAAKVMTKVAELKVAILQHVTDHPGVKASDLWVAIGTKQERGGRVARDALVEEGLIKVSTQGRSEMHFPTGM